VLLVAAATTAMRARIVVAAPRASHAGRRRKRLRLSKLVALLRLTLSVVEHDTGRRREESRAFLDAEDGPIVRDALQLVRAARGEPDR
jgi:hypothetical protein